MNEENKISVVINTYNAEQHLEQVLQAVDGFDEVLICDMESTDGTLDIARRHGCKIVTFPKENHHIVEPAREFAIHQVSHPWVLVVHADEIVTKELKACLYDKIETPDVADGYYISRCNQFLGRYTLVRGRDYILRFFRHAITTWPPTIHSVPVVKGRVERLPEQYEIMHLADETIQQWVRKMNDYTDYEVEKKKDRHFGVCALFWRPFWRFVKNYFLMGGIRNGRRGLLQSLQWAIYQQILVSKIIEKRLREKA